MAKGNKEFKGRLSDAIPILVGEHRFLEVRSYALFSPVYRGDKYTWAKVLEADGLLIASRPVVAGEGRDPKADIEIVVGVVLQSEASTSQGKPDPLGKAAVAHLPNGVWVDLKGEGRRRLDRVLVLFIVPKGAAQGRQDEFETAKRNTENAALFMPDCEVLEVSRGISKEDLAEAIWKKTSRHFRGRGRPKNS